MGREEERYYKDQTRAGVDDNFFNVEVLQEGMGSPPESIIHDNGNFDVLIDDGNDDSDLDGAIAMLD